MNPSIIYDKFVNMKILILNIVLHLIYI